MLLSIVNKHIDKWVGLDHTNVSVGCGRVEVSRLRPTKSLKRPPKKLTLEQESFAVAEWEELAQELILVLNANGYDYMLSNITRNGFTLWEDK